MMPIKLDGKSFNESVAFATPTKDRLLAALQKLPKGQVYTNQEIGKIANVSLNFLMKSEYAEDPRLHLHNFVHNHRRYWGCADAISELRRELNAKKR